MKYLFTILSAIVFFTSSYVWAEDNLVFYSAGRRDPAAWGVLRDYFSSKNYGLSFYQGDRVMERHLEKVNRINTIKSGAFIAIEFVFGQEKQVMVATAGRMGGGTGFEERQRLLWGVDELPEKHEAQSRQLADFVASQFQVTVKKMPLFPLVGIDMPGIFVGIQCKKEEAGGLLALLDSALRKYYRRDK